MQVFEIIATLSCENGERNLEGDRGKESSILCKVG